MTKEDQDLWHTDPNQYIASKDDILDCYDYNIREISLKTFSNIIEKYKNDAIQIIMVIIDSLIFQNDKSDVKKIYNNMISSTPTYVQKSLKEFDFSNLMNLNLQEIFPDDQKFEELKHEVALLILGHFAEDIVAYQENSGGFDFLILYKSLLNVIIKSTSPYVAGRAIWAMSRLNTCTGANDFETNADMIQVFSGFLNQDFHLPVRLVAAKSLNNLVCKIIKDDGDMNAYFKASNIQTHEVHNQLIDILKYCSEQTANLVLTTLKSLHKLDSSLIRMTAESISEPILMLYQSSHNDVHASRVLIDLMLQMLECEVAGKIFLAVFLPNCILYLQNCSQFLLTEHNDIPFAEEESQLNFYISLLELLCQAIKRSNKKKFDKDLLFEAFPIAMHMVLNSTNVIAVIKSTVCIKAYMLHMSSELVSKGYKNSIYKMLKKLLEPKETEILSNYIGNIVMITIEKSIKAQVT